MFGTPACSEVQHQFSCNLTNLSHIYNLVFCVNLVLFIMKSRVPCKRWSSLNSGTWLRRFDNVTGVEKSCVAKGINRKKQRKNILLLQIKIRFLQTSNAWMFAMFKNFMHSQLLKSIFCPRTVAKLRQPKIIQRHNRLLLP